MNHMLIVNVALGTFVKGIEGKTKNVSWFISSSKWQNKSPHVFVDLAVLFDSRPHIQPCYSYKKTQMFLSSVHRGLILKKNYYI